MVKEASAGEATNRQRISAIEEFRTVFSPKRMHRDRPGRSEGQGTARGGN